MIVEPGHAPGHAFHAHHGYILALAQALAEKHVVDAQGQAVRTGDDVGVEDLVRAHQLGQADDLGGLYPGQHTAAPFVGGAQEIELPLHHHDDVLEHLGGADDRVSLPHPLQRDVGAQLVQKGLRMKRGRRAAGGDVDCQAYQLFKAVQSSLIHSPAIPPVPHAAPVPACRCPSCERRDNEKLISS